MDITTIGGKIAGARKNKNLSQAQLGEQLFISAQAVGKWERGESIPDIITFNRMAEILGVDLNYFSENFPSAGNETVPANAPERQLLTNFNGSELSNTDFAGVVAPKRKFVGSALRGADFTAADLTGSYFMGSDVREASFDRANLTDCTFSALALTDARFNETILVRTEFSSSELAGAKFTGVKFIDTKLTTTDLRKTIFVNCYFNGVDFKYSDLRGVCLDGQTFIGVRFNKAALNEATFKGATLKNVSFQPTYALTNKYYRAIKTICFDGALMDKLTYAALKSMGVDLSKVTAI